MQILRATTRLQKAEHANAFRIWESPSCKDKCPMIQFHQFSVQLTSIFLKGNSMTWIDDSECSVELIICPAVQSSIYASIKGTGSLLRVLMCQSPKLYEIHQVVPDKSNLERISKSSFMECQRHCGIFFPHISGFDSSHYWPLTVSNRHAKLSRNSDTFWIPLQRMIRIIWI